MGCMCERTRIKYKPRTKLQQNHTKYNSSNKSNTQPYENFAYGKRHFTINYNVNEETTSNVPSDYLDEVGNFIASKIVKLNNSISSKSNLISSSHYLVRHSLSLYAASSVIIALCYLTTSTTALETSHPIDTNPATAFANKTQDASKATFNSSIFAEGKSDKEILDHLLKNSRYDKRLLPPVDGTLTVNVNVLLLSLASPDESSLKYEVEFLLNQQWYDPRLRYANHSQYEYLNAIHHHDDIWLPDTYFIMHGDFKHPLVPMHFALRIFRNGTITYSMRRHLILSCQGSLNIFPFDDPLCSFALESISYELSAITYVWKNDEDTLRKSPSLTTLNAYLIKNSTIPCPVKNSWREDEESADESDYVCSLCQKRFEPQGNYSCLKVDLIFTRDRAFYFTTVFIPGIILVTSSFITFWLEWNAVPARSMIGSYSCLQVDLTFTRDRAFYFTTVFIPGIILVTSSFITFWLEWNAVPARVMIGVTTMLNFFTTSNSFRGTLPVVSNLTAMNVWDGVCMCFIYASLLEFVCVNYVGRKRPLHNVVYRPGENPVTQIFKTEPSKYNRPQCSMRDVTLSRQHKLSFSGILYGNSGGMQRLPAVLSRIGIILASPLEIIEQEFLAAVSSEKTDQPHHTGGTFRPNIRKRTTIHDTDMKPHDGDDVGVRRRRNVPTTTITTTTTTQDVVLEGDMCGIPGHVLISPSPSSISPPSTSSPPSSPATSPISSSSNTSSMALQPPPPPQEPPVIIMTTAETEIEATIDNQVDIERGEVQYPVKPPRRKMSRCHTIDVDIPATPTTGDNIKTAAATTTTSTTATTTTTTTTSSTTPTTAILESPSERLELETFKDLGEKKRDAGAPNEIVACTNCGGGTSPCTHSANNGCATETCFVQVRKKEPPHPIRVAKTIDVIARITFPTAYAIFLIFFFVHYKGST